MADPNNPFADLIPAQSGGGRVGYIPGVPKAPAIPSGFEPDPDRPGALKPIPGGPADKPESAGQGTEAERTAAFLATRISNGINDINSTLTQHPDAAKPSALASAVGGIFGETGRNYMNSPSRRQIENAQLDILDAALTLGTGAAYTPEQLNNYRQSYFPQLGDDSATIAAKQRRLRVLLESAKVKAGSAAPMIDKALAGIGGEPAPQGGQGEFGGRKDIPALNPQQQAAYDAFTAAHPNASADQIKSFFSAIGFDAQNADAVARAAQEGAGFAPASSAILKPDISDVRGGNNTGTQDAFNAGVRGIADTVSLGLADKAIALGDTVTKGGTFDQNLARQYAISDFDQQNHPIARFGGQAVGGAILPIGDVSSLGNLALKGAGYGAAYGVGSSRSLGDVPMNALLGGAAGAAIPVAIAGGGKVANALSAPLRRGADVAPPLVDPQTGELNQVMDAMRPADRVAAMRDMGIQTITPGMAGGRTARVLEQGFNNLPASAGHMEDINSAASGELRRAMQATAQRFGSSKTLNEGGSELQRGANQYIDRARQLTAKAYDAIPISPDARASTSATEATLEGLTQKFGSNPELAAQMNSPQIQKMLDAIRANGLSWQDLKALRTSIGERIGERRFSDDTATSDLRAVYGALSEDMQNTAAAMGPRAQRAFNRANDLYRNTQQVIDKSLVAILGNDAAKSPEKAAAAVQAMTKGGKSTGDLKTLAQIRAATIKSGAWDEIASTLIHLGGQPANSEGRAFQPQTFVQWYADMSEPARAMLFKPELRKSLDQFVAANQQFARLKGLNNTSQTAPVMFGGGALLTGAGALLNPILGLKMAGVLGLNHVMGRVWTSPQFLRLATGYTKAAAAGNANAVKSQIGRLQKLATTNPELREGIEAVLKSIANDNAVSQVAASPDAQGNQQQ
jgi:hypothetical protein